MLTAHVTVYSVFGMTQRRSKACWREVTPKMWQTFWRFKNSIHFHGKRWPKHSFQCCADNCKNWASPSNTPCSDSCKMFCRVRFWTGKWSPVLYCFVGTDEMMRKAAFHLKMFTSSKGLSHLSPFHTLLTWVLLKKKHVFLGSESKNDTQRLNVRRSYCYIFYLWALNSSHDALLRVDGDSWILLLLAWQQQIWGPLWCSGEKGSTLFPSTGHQCKNHLDHVKPEHLHGVHVFKQTAGESEWDRRSSDSNSGASVGAAVEGKKEGVL